MLIIGLLILYNQQHLKYSGFPQTLYHGLKAGGVCFLSNSYYWQKIVLSRVSNGLFISFPLYSDAIKIHKQSVRTKPTHSLPCPVSN